MTKPWTCIAHLCRPQRRYTSVDRGGRVELRGWEKKSKSGSFSDLVLLLLLISSMLPLRCDVFSYILSPAPTAAAAAVRLNDQTSVSPHMALAEQDRAGSVQNNWKIVAANTPVFCR